MSYVTYERYATPLLDARYADTGAQADALTRARLARY